MIRVQDLSKHYGAKPVLDIDALDLPKGGVAAIIGPNGAGKSTLLSLISRLDTPSAGSVLLDGDDIRSLKSDALARRLAVLRQDNALTARLTVRDLVAFGRYPYSRGRLTATDQAKVDEALGLVGLDGFEDRFLDELSGGQRQRAFIALVLAQDTDYALFDEPLNSLDINHAVAVMRLLRRAADELGKTVVVVLHDLNFAARHADHVIAMQAGRVVHTGTVPEVIRAELLKPLYGMDINVSTIDGRLIVDVFG
ncbi:iron complex transport system ATP-binding protein [Lutimaribacter pacificus]|uniref:Iron complex transport system ATP-binding protein n=1 Tax=Lutimaribacter pacificus TaxID=391948 RepID=A0A1H0BYE3_9RHOB|nr:ATP-binding cassette domain-containing protein [Lutimaribacter pacificus]SDN50669.1 iron complex transport system ATP-binding protein [Lutimaribacter pacificus]SHJ50906.1 iron complex transport system ATP-binding protein [Lutimaribacter pacificus]